MIGLLERVGANLLARLHGPMRFRLIMQPVMAAAFAVRGGLRDARGGRPAYFWAVLTDCGHRAELLRDGWKDVARVFLLATALDAAYQWIEFRWLYPGEALIVALFLALVPYLLIRGPVCRVARKGERVRD